MRKYLKDSLFLIGAICFVFGSAAIIFVENTGIIDFESENTPVNTTMAIACAAVVGLIGVAVFIKRNKIDN